MGITSISLLINGVLTLKTQNANLATVNYRDDSKSHM